MQESEVMTIILLAKVLVLIKVGDMALPRSVVPLYRLDYQETLREGSGKDHL